MQIVGHVSSAECTSYTVQVCMVYGGLQAVSGCAADHIPHLDMYVLFETVQGILFLSFSTFLQLLKQFLSLQEMSGV